MHLRAVQRGRHRPGVQPISGAPPVERVQPGAARSTVSYFPWLRSGANGQRRRAWRRNALVML
jgi:hypothetical protein